jgi:hypothetical protein
MNTVPKDSQDSHVPTEPRQPSHEAVARELNGRRLSRSIRPRTPSRLSARLCIAIAVAAAGRNCGRAAGVTCWSCWQKRPREYRGRLRQRSRDLCRPTGTRQVMKVLVSDNNRVKKGFARPARQGTFPGAGAPSCRRPGGRGQPGGRIEGPRPAPNWRPNAGNQSASEQVGPGRSCGPMWPPCEARRPLSTEPGPTSSAPRTCCRRAP